MTIGAGIVSAALLAYVYVLPERTDKPQSAEELRQVLDNANPSGASQGEPSGTSSVEHARQTSQTRAAAAARLGQIGDEQSIPALLRAMEDPDPVVRGRAGAAVRKIMKADYRFRAADPPERRTEVLANIKRDWEAYLEYKRSPATAGANKQSVP